MPYVLSIDQGTTSTRAIVFDHDGTIVSSGQREHRQHFPRPGWVEHDPDEIWRNTREVIGQALATADLTRHDLVAIGITNQRETAVVWDRRTGRPMYPAIVWQDNRGQEVIDSVLERLSSAQVHARTGLEPSPYFSAAKLAWILDNVPGTRERALRGDLLFGTVDSWLVWNLTGGPEGGRHVTDATNASRTLLMDLERLDWDEELLGLFGIPLSMMPEIRSSSETYGHAERSSLVREVPITGILGDQQAAAFGQAAFEAGQSKSTYGTGNFLLVNTGRVPRLSQNGLLTTIAYKLGAGDVHYALEGAVAVTGSLVQWLRDNLGLIESSADVETLANQVDDTGGVFIVPAFSGLLAPYWRPDARGAVLGLTRYADRRHLARACLESVAFQTADVLTAVTDEFEFAIHELRVDGGMTRNDTLLQIQSDILGMPVIRPTVVETTALGAAYVAGLAVGYWTELEDLRRNWALDRRWEPRTSADSRLERRAMWSKAVGRTLDWAPTDAAPRGT